MILTCIVDDQDDVLPTTRNLVGLRNHLAASGLPVRVAAFHTSDVGDAIEKLVLRQEIGLVVANAAELILAGDDTLSLGILCAAPCDVALHLYRQDPGTAGPLLVPFSGSDHDWAALELATTLAVASGRRLIVTGTAGRESEGGDASRLLASASLIAQQLGGIIAEPLLIPRGADAVVEAAAGASHLITGVPVDYELRGIGRTRREIAGRTPATVTFIRRGRRTGVISPDQNVTQFAWTCTQPG